MFVSLLASFALAVAMVSVPTPARAQTNGVGSRGISLSAGVEQSGYPYQTDAPYDKGRVAPVTLSVKIGDVVYRGYCIEPSMGTLPEAIEGTIVDWKDYSSDAPIPNMLGGNRDRQEKLSWVAFNGYPHKSVAELSAAAGTNLNIPEAVAATQAAVHYYSDGIKPDFSRNPANSKAEQQNRQHMEALYNYLTGAANVGISNDALSGVGGRAFVPNVANGHQDVIIFPPTGEEPTPSSTETSTTATTSGEPTPSTAPSVPSVPTSGETSPTTTSPAESTTSKETTPAESTSPATSTRPSNPEGKIATRVSVNGVESSKDAPVTVKAGDVAAGLNIKDTITYNGLVAGKKYRFEGQLQQVDGDTVTPVGDVKSVEITAAEGGSGEAVVDFGKVEGLNPGATYVVFEKAIPLDAEGNPTTDDAGEPKDSEADSRKVIKHEEPGDKAQTFVVENPEPAIKTRAEFKDGASEIKAGTVVVDTVTYSNLVAGKSYTLDAKLVDKQDANNVLGTGAVTFTAEGNEGDFVNGNVKVEITVDDDVTEPVPAAVAFERLTSTEVNAQGDETDGEKTNEIAEHEDIDDEAQTVRTVFEPGIATNAKFQDGSTKVAAGNTVIDTVDYKGLVPGKEYTLSAQLIDKADGKTVVGTGTKTFTPENTEGSVEVAIKVNDDVTEPVPAAVAFEELTSTVVDKTGQDKPQGGNTPGDYSDDNQIAEHKDINDGNQTVEGPVNTPTSETSTTTEETTSEEPAPTTTIQLLPSTEPSAPSESSSEETTSAESTTPTTDVCEPVVTTSTVPGTTVPGSTVPSSTGPDTTVPGSTVPGTTVEESTTEVTTVPETCASTTEEESTTPATTKPANNGGSSSDFDKKKLRWLLLIPGLGLIPALLGGGNGSSNPAPKPTPAPQESKPAPAPSNEPVPAPNPAGKPVPADSPRGEIKQIPSGGTVLEADMPDYI